MKQTELVQALQIAVTANVPVIIWGPPGAGKTATVNALAAEMGWPMETVVASLREPSDFAGLPVLIGEQVRLAPPDWASRLATVSEGLCFFDEISTASPATQRALLRVIHERVVGDLALGEGVRMIAAANPADVAAGGWDLSPPLANRFLHLTYEVDAKVVAEGLLGRWPSTRPLTVPAGWEQHMAVVRRQVAAFVTARPSLVHDLPTSLDQAGLAWPSPRSWESVIKVLAACEGSGISEEARFGLVAGLVGEGTALEFLAYARDLDIPDPEVLLADLSAYQRLPRADQVHALISAVIDAVTNDLTAHRWTQAMRLFARIAAEGTVDIGAQGVRALSVLRPDDAEIPPELAEFGEVLMAAGMLAV